MRLRAMASLVAVGLVTPAFAQEVSNAGVKVRVQPAASE